MGDASYGETIKLSVFTLSEKIGNVSVAIAEITVHRMSRGEGSDSLK